MITVKFVQSVYDDILADVVCVLPMIEWIHKPTALGYTDEKTKYGLATNEGMILINRLFIGTTATTKLDYTLRHEFAHLAIGLRESHNRAFKRLEERFGVDLNRDLSEDISKIQNKIAYKYTVLAHLENGEVRVIGGVHRKTRRYTEYPTNKSRFKLSVDGIRILSFEYRVNAANKIGV